jgi:hypothetical protein
MARKQREQLTDEEICHLCEVGQMMCQDMIIEASNADRIAVLGGSSRVTPEAIDAWIAIAKEYAAALDDLETSHAT